MSSSLERLDQEVLTVSSALTSESLYSLSSEIYILKYSSENKVLPYIKTEYPILDPENKFKSLYRNYRASWSSQPKDAIHGEQDFLSVPPLCLDIEVASICDLACPFCYRSYLATPDKLISDDLAYKLIDQAAELKIPSIKFNWRGEPLMHPRLEKYISYAKERGILETLLNTNATHLNQDRAKSLIESGLDVLIYSFDGGTKETYEKNRPGRFSSNKFEDVVENIQMFSKVRTSLGRHLPFTKIQMILTTDTFPEQEPFYQLFKSCVDSVTVTQYSERGGEISDLNDSDLSEFKTLCKIHSIPVTPDVSYMKDSLGTISISNERKPCEQPFQRLLVTYDGRVSMCCYDWGAKYTVGLSQEIHNNDPNYDKEKILDLAQSNSPGFELLSNIEMPEQYIDLPPVSSSLKEIWNSPSIRSARRAHIDQSSLPDICAKCSFKDTYKWLSK